MLIINFYKKIETSWEELKLLALKEIDDYEKTISADEPSWNGLISAKEEYHDYRKAVSLGLKTFILQVLNDWSPVEHPILVIGSEFFQRFEILEFDGFLGGLKIPNKIHTREMLLKVLKEAKIEVKPAEFDKLCDYYDCSEEVFCDIIEVQYQLIETEEFRDYEGKYLDSEEEDDDYDEDDHIDF